MTAVTLAATVRRHRTLGIGVLYAGTIAMVLAVVAFL
jgi:hypothetical protein